MQNTHDHDHDHPHDHDQTTRTTTTTTTRPATRIHPRTTRRGGIQSSSFLTSARTSAR